MNKINVLENKNLNSHLFYLWTQKNLNDYICNKLFDGFYRGESLIINNVFKGKRR